MCAKDDKPTILIATGNAGKFREIASELQCPAIALISLNDLAPLPECRETGTTFEQNADQKASTYARATGYITLADDSGLEVDALDGRPGVQSARYAGEPCDDLANNKKLVGELSNVPPENRTARFRCAMSLADSSGRILARTTGVIEGVIVDAPRGENGFGYDPHFLLPAAGKTTAEISPTEKNRISHRGQATRAMKEIIHNLLADR